MESKNCDHELNHPKKLITQSLFGDYELIIDECFDRDMQLKYRVALADKRNRGGRDILLNAVHNRKVPLSSYHEHILNVCKDDQVYFQEKQNDLKHITCFGSRYRVRVTVLHSRFSKNFDCLFQAQAWRDKMLILHRQIKHL